MIRKVRKFWASLALLSIELLIILVLFVISLFTFIFLTNNIFSLKDTHFDSNVFLSVRPMINEANTVIMRFITFFATHNFLIPANLLIIFYYLALKKHRWYSIKVPVVSLGSFVIMAALKLFFSRPRPDDPVYEAARGFSYPSGHAMSAMTFYGLIIYLVWHNVENKIVRWMIIVLLLFFIFLIGFSRVYLRVHFASDVLAGFAMGVVWLVISIWIMNKLEKYTRKEIAPAVNSSPE